MTEVQKICFKGLIELDAFCRRLHLTYFISGGTLLGAVREKGFIPWDDDIDVYMPRKDYDFLLSALNENSKETPIYFDNWKEDVHYHLAFGKLRIKGTDAHFKDDYVFGTKEKGYWIDIFPLDECPNPDSIAYNKWKKRRIRLAFLISCKSLPFKKMFTWKQRLAKPLCIFLKRSWLIKQFEKPFKKPQTHLVCTSSCFDRDYFVVFPKEYLRETVPLTFEGIQVMAPNGYHEILTQMYGDYMTPPPPSERQTHFGN